MSSREIIVENLVKKYNGSVKAVNDVSFKVESGQIFFRPIDKIDPGREIIHKVTVRAHQPGGHLFRRVLEFLGLLGQARSNHDEGNVSLWDDLYSVQARSTCFQPVIRLHATYCEHPPYDCTVSPLVSVRTRCRPEYARQGNRKRFDQTCTGLCRLRSASVLL